MWLRRQLVSLFGLEERAAHAPREVGWKSLPEACALQIHWPRKRGFVRTLERHGFKVVVLARHPLDVLVSILHFAVHEPETARWLDGAFGDERSIIGAHPTSRAFRSYAVGQRAQALIGLSSQWWERGLVSIRYEDLVASPERELGRIVDAVGVTPRLSPATVAETVTFESLRSEVNNQHFWQGRPNHWRELLPAKIATEIADPHSTVIRQLGYDLQPDPELSCADAIGRWNARVVSYNRLS